MSEKLHEAIVDVLSSSSKMLTVKEIADIIGEKRLWQRPSDGKFPKQEQVSARINNYPKLFNRKNGIVSLKEATATRAKKISRITWNDNRWIAPSGWGNKSKDKNSHEGKYGFGHEEWLFDFSKLIDGYHYGFLEPIHKNRVKYIGSIFDISLYTINARTKERFWIGEIQNVEVISYDETISVVKIYQKKNWISEMLQQLEDVAVDSNVLKPWIDQTLFNIRFRPTDYKPLIQPIKIDPADKAIGSARYILLNDLGAPLRVKEIDGNFVFGKTTGKWSDQTSITKKFQEKTVEIPQLHNEICIKLEKYLKSKYAEVVPENNTGYGTSIDIAVKHHRQLYFFEVKTYSHVLTCIRVALGQLIEYSYFPEKKVASKLFIVTQHALTPDAKAYILHLKRSLNLPLYYIHVDLVNNAITEEV